MLARAVFFDKIADKNILYNSHNGERCNIGIVEIHDRLSKEELAKVHSSSITVVGIPKEISALYTILKGKHKLFDGDKDIYEMSTTHIEKEWIIQEINVDSKIYDFVCFSRGDASILNRYYYVKYILGYLDKHDLDLYTPDYIYNLLGHIDSYIATTDFERKIKDRLLNVVCTYIRDKSNREKGKGHSEEYYKYFSEDDTDDEIFRNISSPSIILEYIKDIIIDYEIGIINEQLHL